MRCKHVLEVALLLGLVGLPGTRGQGGGGIVSGVDLDGLVAELGWAAGIRGASRAGAFYWERESKWRLAVSVWQGEDAAREHFGRVISVRTIAPTEQSFGISDECMWWGRPDLDFRRGNVVCSVAGEELDSVLATAKHVDDLLQTSDTIAPKGDAGQPFRLALRYPSEAHQGDKLTIEYSVRDVDSVCIEDYMTPQPPRGTLEVIVQREGREPGYYTRDIWFASPMCVMAKRAIRIRILPAEQ